MRRLLALAFLLFSCAASGQYGGDKSYVSGSSVTYAYVNGALSTGNGPRTWTYSPTAGHIVLVGGYSCNDSGACTTSTTGLSIVISDNLNNPETCFVKSSSSPVTISSTAGYKLLWYFWLCPSIPSGVTSITTTPSTSNTNAATWFNDLTCVGCSKTWDVEGYNYAAATNTTGTASATTTHASDFCMGMVDNDNDEAQTSYGAGWSQGVADSHNNGRWQYIAPTSASTQTVSATWTPTDTFEAYIGCFY